MEEEAAGSGEAAALAAALPPAALATRCDPAALTVAAPARADGIDPEGLEGAADGFGQARAVEALRLALSVPGPGYNVFVLAEPGVDPAGPLQQLLRRHAASRPPAPDWCYLFNFGAPNRPRLLSLPPGEGRRLRDAMQRFTGDLAKAVTGALDGDEYRSRLEAIQALAKEHEDGALRTLGDEAAAQGVALLRTPQGFAFAPMHGEHPMAPADFDRLAEAERRRIEQAIQALRDKLQKLLHELPRLRREMQQRVREATRDTLALAAGHLIDEVKAQFKGRQPIDRWLDEVRRDIVEAGDRLREAGSETEAEGRLAGQLTLQRYEVNLFVGDGSEDGEDLGPGLSDAASAQDAATDEPPGAGAPPAADRGADGHRHALVRTCEHPTYANLVGRIDHIAHMGTLLTNFTLIRAGALHRANGGVLLLDALKVLTEPMAWAGLKRALRSGHVVIESLPQALGWAQTLPLEPEPVPLDLKIVLVGQRRHYYLLQALDPEFDDLFKVAADFEDDIERTEATSAALGWRLRALATGHGLRPPAPGALARLVDHAARRAGDAARLSTHARPMADLLREADAQAARAGRAGPHAGGTIERADVESALAARIRRADRLRDRLHDALARGLLHVATEGTRMAQVNGLAVMELGDFRFGHPVRITATTRLGDGHVVDIEREATLGGALHTKGVMILSAFLAARYAQGTPLSLAASLVFEQSYGPVEGDSASLAELCALLSALAGVPVRQDRAVTGSVDQHGRVQAVGGVNEKIEGFFELCRARGLSGTQGVLIPHANVQHLMLRDEVVAAAEAGRFHVWPVDDVDAALALLTGTRAGTPDARGVMPEGSINQRVTQRLLDLSQRRQRWAAPGAKTRGGRRTGIARREGTPREG